MPTLPTPPGMTPHWAGAWAALVGTLLLMGWLWRARHLSRRRWVIAMVMLPQLTLLALIGNGTRGVHIVGFELLSAPSRLADPWLGQASQVATSPDFLAYYGRITGVETPLDGGELQDRLHVQFMSYEDLTRQGLAPPPEARGKRLLFYEYVDRQNAFFPLVGVGTEAFDARATFVRWWLFEGLDELFWLEACRAAPDDASRVAALEALTRHGVPMPAEWVARELARIEAAPGAAPDSSAAGAFAAARQWAQRYVDDPTLRALPPGTVIPLK